MGVQTTRPTKWYVLLGVGFACLLISLVLLIAFPLAIFPSLVRSQIPLKENEDGTLTKTTSLWKDLPVNNYFNFYFFNVTNIDEVLYEGAKAQLVEVGPYTYLENEFKEGLEWRDDGKKIFFRNNKTWKYSPKASCDGCSPEDSVTLPNPAYMTIVSLRMKTDVSRLFGFLLDILLVSTGEEPIRTVPVGGVLFDSYPDPLIEILNSNLTVLIKLACNGTLFGLPVPDIQYLGYFPKYNHTADGDYLITTGEDDVDQVQEILEWSGMTELPWWEGVARSDHVGAGDGTFYKPFLTKDDRPKLFESFVCRTFDMEYVTKKTVNDIETLEFRFSSDSFDTTLRSNLGYQYENTERVDYYPSWPSCPNHTFNPFRPACEAVDCRIGENYCDDCCDGSHDADTVYLPPGIVPLRCLPGQNKLIPFPAFFSPPHFSASPPQVHETMVGLRPDEDLFYPGTWFINPTTGSTVHAIFQLQLIIPLFLNEQFTSLSQVRNALLPSFWLRADAGMKDYAHDFVLLSSKTIPSIILGVGIALLILSLLLILIALICINRQGKNKKVLKLSEGTADASTANETLPPPAPLRITTAPGDDQPVQPVSAPALEQASGRESPERIEDLHWHSKTLRDERYSPASVHEKAVRPSGQQWT